MTTRRPAPETLAYETGADLDEVRESPYVRGYWLRVGGYPRPKDPKEREGWDEANGEIKSEKDG